MHSVRIDYDANHDSDWLIPCATFVTIAEFHSDLRVTSGIDKLQAVGDAFSTTNRYPHALSSDLSSA